MQNNLKIHKKKCFMINFYLLKIYLCKWIYAAMWYSIHLYKKKEVCLYEHWFWGNAYWFLLVQERPPENKLTNEINRTLRNGWSSFGKNSIILKINMPIGLKRKIFNQCLDGAETWTLIKRMVKRLQIIQRNMENIWKA